MLKARAHVVGDIAHNSLAVEPGAYFDGRSVHAEAQRPPEKLTARLRRREADLNAGRAPAHA